MKKTILFIAIALIFVSAANAQFLKFGIKGGITSSSVKFDETTFTSTGGDDFIAKQGDAKYGYQFGLFARGHL